MSIDIDPLDPIGSEDPDLQREGEDRAQATRDQIASRFAVRLEKLDVRYRTRSAA